jgi:hypothetical protein
MERRRNACQRRLSREYESNRLEEQVWAMAYELLWPLLRRALSGRGTSANALDRPKGQAVATVRRA